MARLTNKRDLGPVLYAAEQWIHQCLISDGSILSSATLWTAQNAAELRRAFVEHPDEGQADFTTKLKGQMKSVSSWSQRLMGEMLWALLLFPSNIRPNTKRQQISEIWALSGEALSLDLPMLKDEVLCGIGSGGPGFNNHRWRELVFLIEVVERLEKENPSSVLDFYEEPLRSGWGDDKDTDDQGEQICRRQSF